jgi:hypothetical protein
MTSFSSSSAAPCGHVYQLRRSELREADLDVFERTFG